MRPFALALAAAAAVAVTAPAQATTTLIDEDFTTGFGVFTATGQVGIATGTDYIPCCSTTGSAANMNNPFAAFGSGGQPSGTLESPTIQFVNGETYTFDFDFAELGSGVETLTILVGSFATITVSNFANNNLDTTFSHISVPLTIFTPTSSGTIRISSSGGADVDSIIDNFVVTTTANLPPLTAPGIPEPATWAMMLLGFGAIGVALRRHNRLPSLA